MRKNQCKYDIRYSERNSKLKTRRERQDVETAKFTPTGYIIKGQYEWAEDLRDGVRLSIE